MAIARWGLRLALGTHDAGDAFHPGWAVLALQATFRPEEATGVHESYEFRVDDDIFHARVHDGQVESVHGPAWQPTVTVTCDGSMFRALAAGELSLEDAARSHRIEVDGDRRALRRFERIFRMPETASLGPERSVRAARHITPPKGRAAQDRARA
jgi:hypothetical protein